jgi:hypothetical protein
LITTTPAAQKVQRHVASALEASYVNDATALLVCSLIDQTFCVGLLTILKTSMGLTGFDHETAQLGKRAGMQLPQQCKKINAAFIASDFGVAA